MCSLHSLGIPKAAMHLLRSSRLFFFVFILLLSTKISAQRYDTGSIFREPITMDSFVMTHGFDVNAFIRKVRADTTFYKAFRSMHLVPDDAVNDIKVYDKDGGVIASMHSKTKQKRDKGCRTTVVTEEQTTGDFYDRDGGYKYSYWPSFLLTCSLQSNRYVMKMI